jgi:transposase
VARRLGVGKYSIRRLYDRWRVRGGTTLLTKPTKRFFSFEFKLDAVRRYISGANRVALAKELQLSSPKLIDKWVRQYGTEGEDGLCPKPKGRPKTNPEAPA